MQLNPYLGFNGNCEAAFKFYEKVLDGKDLYMVTYADTPMAKDVSGEWLKKIVHARMNVDGTSLMGADAPPGCFKKAQGISVMLGIKEVADAERVFKALSEKGSIIMPIAETFWAKRFGMVEDQFGIPWMINCEKMSS